MLTNLTLTLFIISMIWAVYSDTKYYILSNKLCLSVLALYPIFVTSLYIEGTPLPLDYILYSLAIAVVIFLCLAALFAFNFIGGGDVKLIPAVALWAGPLFILKFLFITALSGGVLSLIFICFFYLKSRKLNKSSEKINLSMSESTKETNEENKIPYGIAISIGGIYVATELLKL